uniref:N-acetylneuraminate synthase family protein n=1 Tax=Deinococcus sp. GbtcB9 TaxID=2824754 RepID=UPI001C2F9434
MKNFVYIIAEAGVNHNGSLDIAYALVDAAVRAGANAIKFQTFKAENLVTRKAKQADYQVINVGEETSQYEM